MFFKRILNIKYAVAGLIYAVRHDISIKLEVVIGLPAVALIGYFGRPLSEMDAVLLCLSYLLILITELQNSALESALDRVHPEVHDQIGRSKDMAAASVLLAGLFAFGVIIKVLCF